MRIIKLRYLGKEFYVIPGERSEEKDKIESAINAVLAYYGGKNTFDRDLSKRKSDLYGKNCYSDDGNNSIVIKDNLILGYEWYSMRSTNGNYINLHVYDDHGMELDRMRFEHIYTVSYNARPRPKFTFHGYYIDREVRICGSNSYVLEIMP